MKNVPGWAVVVVAFVAVVIVVVVVVVIAVVVIAVIVIAVVVDKSTLTSTTEIKKMHFSVFLTVLHILVP